MAYPALDETLIRSVFRPETSKLCRQLAVFQEIESTNSFMLDELSRGMLQRGDVYFSETQSAGRGRLSRSWVSPPNGNLYFSVLWSHNKEKISLGHWNLLPLSIGVSIASYLRKLAGDGIALKWPNDILLDGRKISGILVDRIVKDKWTYWIIGVGLNFADMTVHDLTNINVAPGCLQTAMPDCLVRRNEIAGKMVEAVFEACQNLNENNASHVLKNYEQFDYLKDKEIELLMHDGSIKTGYSNGIASDGALQFLSGGDKQKYYSGDIRLKIK